MNQQQILPMALQARLLFEALVDGRDEGSLLTGPMLPSESREHHLP
ncbi:MAG TPA: hypothetical protein VL242_19035 [Sorangium sp.]|nr:hypothetical protein [Sorangium sp.]